MPRCEPRSLSGIYDPDDERFICQDRDSLYWGCDASCHPCVEDSGVPHVDWVSPLDGKRWIRPHPVLESRNASGEYEIIRADSPVRTSPFATYQLAQCFVPASGQELFKSTICDCPELCRSGDLGLQYRPFPTCGVYQGSGWPPHIQCAGLLYPLGPIAVSFGGSHLHNLGTVRTTTEALVTHMPSGCTDNAMALCAGHVHSGPCSLTGGYWEGYIADIVGSYRGLWDWLDVREINAQFHVPDEDDYPLAEVAEIELRNDVLAWLERDRARGAAGNTHMDEVDSMRRGQNDYVNVNSQLEQFERLWPPNDAPIPLDKCPAITAEGGGALLTGRLRELGTPVLVDYVLQSVRFQVAFQVIRRLTETTGEIPRIYRPLYPAVRIRLEMQMGLRCRFPGAAPSYVRWHLDENHPRRETELSIETTPNRGWARVVPDYDVIDYRDRHNRPVVPPLDLVWHGHLGPLSDPPWPNIMGEDLWDYYTRVTCCLMAKGMYAEPGEEGGLRVPARESHPESHTRGRNRWDCTGDIVLSANQSFHGTCDGTIDT